MQPHKSEYWIFPKIENEEEFVKRISKICQVYEEAIEPQTETLVTCTDEKTGIQAVNNVKITAVEKGKLQKIDPEYRRNGTTCLMAGLDVATGKIIQENQGQTRNEQDFLNHVKQIISKNPDSKHVIVCDQLNTHKSESLVTWVSSQIGYEKDLGIKGKIGILKTMGSRMEFLENETHRIRFQFTPKHCSWMNQIENWFGFLQRRVIKNGQFESVSILEEKIEKFIIYYNQYLAKPIKWSFNGDKYLQKLSV